MLADAIGFCVLYTSYVVLPISRVALSKLLNYYEPHNGCKCLEINGNNGKEWIKQNFENVKRSAWCPAKTSNLARDGSWAWRFRMRFIYDLKCESRHIMRYRWVPPKQLNYSFCRKLKCIIISVLHLIYASVFNFIYFKLRLIRSTRCIMQLSTTTKKRHHGMRSPTKCYELWLWIIHYSSSQPHDNNGRSPRSCRSTPYIPWPIPSSIQ